MKKTIFYNLFLASLCAFVSPNIALAFSGDLALYENNIRFSSSQFTEGAAVRIYVAVKNESGGDLLGVVKFFDNGAQIKTDQPVSVLSSKDDSVFVDWLPAAGEHIIKIALYPLDAKGDNPDNNTIEKKISVLQDTDRDKNPNSTDPDDDNDGTPDALDSFPLNSKESADTDGDGIGDNTDDDDDNDDIKDINDAFPLDPTQWLDTDRDGIGDNTDEDDDGDFLSDEDETKIGTNPLLIDTDGDMVSDKNDAFPLDPTQSKDYDKDGVSDTKDADADNDGIVKNLDVNDTNLGPVVNITSEGKAPALFVAPNEPVPFETATSFDPDGKISSVNWWVADKEFSGEKVKLSFKSLGLQTVKVTVTDDKGEPRIKTFKIFVTPPYMIWGIILIIFVITILAIFLVFSYSKRRQSRFQKAHNAMNSVIKWLDLISKKPKK